MKIVWDETKRQRNLDVHGLDFADLADFDWERALIRDGHTSERGGRRFKALGEMEGHLVAVIFAKLGAEAYSIISMRPASRDERALHDESEEDET
ncbi:MAG TPA: BrnT family toxin [Beijerinckiaceae bacterium]|jgi:uncharacterized DUF497 family protein|nr:BrnT family toxin [Beijerinckiaceae bacterium]